MTDSPRTIRVRNTLAAAVRIATGLPDARPRPGQIELADDLTKAADPLGGQMSGIAPTGVGKALDITTPIATPSGWTAMGDLVVGDELFDENGEIIVVTEAHPVRTDRDCYEVNFSDGSTIVADAEHLWFTTTRAERQEQALSGIARSVGSVSTTLELLPAVSDSAGDSRISVPVAGALRTHDIELEVDPFELGSSLGGAHNPFEAPGTKFIPAQYLRSGTDQRLALVAGLFRSDALVTKEGEWSLRLSTERLARGTLELLTSLGVAASIGSDPRSIVQPEPGQRSIRYITSINKVESRPVRCITVSGSSHLFLAGTAMIPTHNSLTGLSEAAVGAVVYGERWIISTESIGLQSQYVDKDGPVISAAAEEVLGQPVSIAVLKGWSNYTCVMKARETAIQMGVDMPASDSKIIKVAERVAKAKLAKTVVVDGYDMESASLKPLVSWALAQHADESLPGDRGSYQGIASDYEWQSVSVSPAECLNDTCPLIVLCKPTKSREAVAEADIVITNHSMLAVQAATGAPVVIGSQRLGQFDGIIVDEAHALPSIVRNQGQSEVSGRRILSAVKKVKGVLSDRDPHVMKWVDDGHHIANYVENELAGNMSAKDINAVKIPEDKDPLESTGDLLIEFLRRGAKFVQSGTGKSSDMSTMIRGKRAVSELDNLVRDVGAVREHFVGTARWLQPMRPQTPAERLAAKGREWSKAQAAPVAVGRMIERNVWNEVTKATEDEDEIVRPLTVAALSATLPQGFNRDIGLSLAAPPRHYASPFDQAYGNSMLYVPRAVDADDVNALGSHQYGKMKFDTKKHAEWATGYMLPLVDANGGSALILSATKGAGLTYTKHLRNAARGRWNVYSQWDGENVRVITQRWRDDPTGVMVGTKSLMTGVDAPGETCSLVIVDRAPRAAGNPVDDARVEMISESMDGGKWAADALVYVSDATLLLEQALGRLIRSTSDSGMAAILDPRMLKAGPFQYNDKVRKAYQTAMARFPNKTTSIDDAVSYLNNRQANLRSKH